MPKPYNAPLPGVHEPCPYCRSTDRFVRDKGPNIGICCPEGHFTASPTWLSKDEFRDGGKYFGLLPVEDFDTHRRRRSKNFQIIEHIRVAVCQESMCYLCGKVKFEPPRTADNVLAWLKSEHRSLYYRIVDHFAKGRRDGLVSVPRDWSKHVPQALYDEIDQQIDFSRIQADHLIPVMFLELLEKHAEPVPKKVIEFAGRRLAVPLCEPCNRGRHLHLESPERMLQRWIAYKFDGNRRAAEDSPEWPWAWIEMLVQRTGRIQRDLIKIRRG